MDKLIILKSGEIQKEVELEADTLTIGRDTRSDIPLRDPSVSRQHARLTKLYNDYCLEDLDSTNGTYLNDQSVSKHMLKHGDLLRIGSFTLRYVGREGDEPADDPDRTVVVQAPQPAAAGQLPQPRRDPNKVSLPKTATLRFFRGPKKGLQDRIDRTLYTIGRPGGEVAAVARRPQGFFLLHIGGDRYPRINNEEIGTIKGILLHEGDVIEVGEHLAEITFKN